MLSRKKTAYKLIGTQLLSMLALNLAHATTLSLAGGGLHLDYCESDTQNLTHDGVLNTEQGSMALAVVELSSSLQIKSSQIWGALGFEYAKGQSQYDGYLQSGRNLLAYKSATMNIFTTYSAKLGMAFGDNNSLLKPYIALKNAKWQRRLDNYTEYYTLPSWQLGISWQLAVGAKLQLIPELAIEQFEHSKISVPFYDFAKPIPAKRPHFVFAIKAAYAPNHKLGIFIKITSNNYQLAASSIDQHSKLQLPPSKTQQYQGVIGVSLNFD